jgi:hypothetical protein
MKNIYYFVVPFLALCASVILWGCDAAEDFAEHQATQYDTTIVINDTVRKHTDAKFEPVKFELEIQLGSFASKTYADNLAAKADLILNRKTEVIFEDNVYRVSAGRFTIPDRANAYLEYVKEKGFTDAYIRKIRKINDD